MALEATLCVLVLAAVLLWLIAPLRRARRAASAAILLGGALLVSSLATRERPLAEAEVRNRPIQVASDGYVGSSTCRACHPDQYASWHGSWHRTMTQVATPRTVVGDFDAVEVTAYGRTFRLEREDGAFWVEMDDPDAAGDPGQRIRRRILMTTGAHHEQDVWFETGHSRRLGLLPLMYLVEERRWIPFTAGFLRPPVSELPTREQLDRWQTTCIKCHTTHGRPRTAPANPDFEMDTTVAEFGIACEACHGPAAEHVRANRTPLRRYRLHLLGGDDPTIVHPGRLSAARASQVCGQCHAIHRPRRPLPRLRREADDWRDRGLAYRPGDDLEATRYLVLAERAGEARLEQIRAFDPHLLEDRFWRDGMVRVSGREYNGLVRSPCFERGQGERRLSCLSCHAMHQQRDDPRTLATWADDQLGVGMRGNGACLGCHEGFASEAALTDHTHHEPDSSGSLCYNCHMPHTTYGLLKAIRSHTIDSPTLEALRDTGRPLACNQCHLDRSVAWTSRYLERWSGDAQPDVPPALRGVAASVVWALGGDAGQRALAAWSFGWAPALEASASEEEWIAPFLAILLADPYDAVRLIAYRSLRRQPGFADFAYDPMDPEPARRAAARRAQQIWSARRLAAGLPLRPHSVIFDPQGLLPADILERIYAQRNDARVFLAE